MTGYQSDVGRDENKRKQAKGAKRHVRPASVVMEVTSIDRTQPCHAMLAYGVR